jgi:hypothetical protein
MSILNTKTGNASGPMTATLPTGEQFIAQDVWFDPLGGVLGIRNPAQGVEEFIYIGFPLGIKDGDHTLGEGGTSAYLGSDVSGPAHSGVIQSLVWNREECGVAGKFEFNGKDEYARDFQVSKGVFDIAYEKPASTLQRNTASAASAVIVPALKDNAEFNANERGYNGDRERPTFVAVKQSIGLEGGLLALGAVFLLEYDQNNQPSVKRAFASVNHGLIAAEDYAITQLAWAPGKALSFAFTLAFHYNAQPFTFQAGRVDLKL